MQKNKTRRPDTPGEFTLIEISVAIILISILVAFAQLRFIAITPQAHITSLENLQSNLQAGASFANAQCRLAEGCLKSGWGSGMVVSPDGTKGRMYNGYPTSNATEFASHITEWVEVSGFSIDTSNPSFTDFTSKNDTQSDDCRVRYHSAQQFGEAPSIVLTSSGC